MNDQQLLLLLQNSPSQGLAKAIDLYGDSVRWIVYKIVGPNYPEDIEECVSDVFIRFWQSIRRFDSESGVPLKSYLYGISRYAALDFRKKQRESSSISFEENMLQSDLDFADTIVEKTNSSILHEVIAALPSPEQEIFIRRYFLEERVKAIANELKLSEKTIENKLYRGKISLKKQLIERGFII